MASFVQFLAVVYFTSSHHPGEQGECVDVTQPSEQSNG